MEHIVFLEKNSIRATVRQPSFPHTWTEYEKTAPQEVLDRLKDATIVITNKVRLTGELLARLPKLRLIAEAATGTDNIDLAWCREHKLPVTNIRGYAVDTVPEHVFMLLLALRRQLPAYRADVAAGKWQRSPMFCFFDHPIRDLRGSTLGIFGRGSLGRGVARLAEAFDMRVLWGERKGVAAVREGYVSFETLLAEADAISLHCPLDDRTRGMFGETELRAMKRDAVLINTARGGLVDETALLRALREGWIAGAGFDVLSKEPPADGNPLLDVELPNLIVTPHVAWSSDTAMQSLADQLIDNMEAFIGGEERNRVA
ncbi:MAG: D-2-hydroxyacid dehydrogenase [Gammaproteobacteria bacterium]|nr:D-2-hydroxyacid dehydrogenase [Gammaproteobacteria bacterium]MBU1415607.1 D-2-hydroxyacid dehydrogenase [Gammaproteobacteria bacterium]